MKKESIFSKTLIILILLFIGITPIMAQISEGEPFSRSIKTGNRPGMGDWGIFIVPSLTDISSMIDKYIAWQGLPLVNIKHYHSDNLELRKGQKLPYTVEKKSDGSYVATTQILKYSVVIPSADSTTGYISIEHNNQTLKININKK